MPLHFKCNFVQHYPHGKSRRFSSTSSENKKSSFVWGFYTFQTVKNNTGALRSVSYSHKITQTLGTVIVNLKADQTYISDITKKASLKPN